MSLTSWAPHLGTLKEIEKEFPEMDHIVDNETEPLVIHLSDNTDSDGKGEESGFKKPEKQNRLYLESHSKQILKVLQVNVISCLFVFVLIIFEGAYLREGLLNVDINERLEERINK